jgi:hypothetical protein
MQSLQSTSKNRNLKNTFNHAQLQTVQHYAGKSGTQNVSTVITPLLYDNFLTDGISWLKGCALYEWDDEIS